MPRGRPPKPIEQKRRTGNPGGRPLPKPADLVALPALDADAVPAPLRLLGAPGRQLWDRVWASGARWISPDTDAEIVQLLCETADERAAVRLSVLRGGDWHDRIALRSLDAQVTAMLGAIGFSPADRARLGVAEVRPRSTLDRLRAERADRGPGA